MLVYGISLEPEKKNLNLGTRSNCRGWWLDDVAMAVFCSFPWIHTSRVCNRNFYFIIEKHAKNIGMGQTFFTDLLFTNKINLILINICLSIYN